MDLHVLGAVFVIWSVAAISPGPNFFITVHTAVSAGRQQSMFTVMGIITGTLIWTLSGYLGISILFSTLPLLGLTLKIVGGLYLVYLGCKLLIERKKNQPQVETDAPQSPLQCFRLGFLTNLLNPKTAAFVASLFAATLPPAAPVELGVMTILLTCSISALWYSLVSILFSSAKVRQLYLRQKERIAQAAGIIFIGFGVQLAASN